MFTLKFEINEDVVRSLTLGIRDSDVQQFMDYLYSHIEDLETGLWGKLADDLFDMYQEYKGQ